MQIITPQELKEKLDAKENILVLDVREPFEYSDWHISGSINIPVSNFMRHPLPALPKDKEIIAVCAHGMRSQAAARALSSAGYTTSSMEGGMVEWNGVYDTLKISNDVFQIRRIGKGCLSYLIVSENQAAVIDSSVDIDVYENLAREANAKIVAVLDTHAHADHASGGVAMSKKLGIHYYAPGEVGNAPHTQVKEGFAVKLGSEHIIIIDAPGHTPGSLAYKFGEFIFTGDTLFVDGVGRPDLGQDAGKNAPILYQTIQKILSLDGTILPAHAEIDKIHHGKPISADVSDVRNLDILRKSESEFISWIASSNRPAPNNFQTIKQFNTGMIRIDDVHDFRELEAGANRCQVK